LCAQEALLEGLDDALGRVVDEWERCDGEKAEQLSQEEEKIEPAAQKTKGELYLSPICPPLS